MIGHEQIIAVRMAGGAPKMVELFLFPIKRWAIKEPPCPSECMFVEMDDRARPERLDLRFVVGLVVKVNGYDESRVSAFLEACRRAGASRTLGTVFKRPKVIGYSLDEVIQLMDSKGIFVWQP